MLYCFYGKIAPNARVECEIERSIAENSYIYYDYENKVFRDNNDQEIDIYKKEIMPTAGIFQINELLEKLEVGEAVIPTTRVEFEKIEEWYKYLETKRQLVSFTGRMLEDEAFLTYLYESFGSEVEVFLKTRNKDFNGFVLLEELFNSESDLRKAFSYHLEDEFLLSNKVNIDKDEIGNNEYRAFIKDGKIMNISRITDYIYHQIPGEILVYIEEILSDIDESFPKTFVLDVFSYDGILDILELNPMEASGRYLYNTIFEESNDLLHLDVENVPKEKRKDKLGYECNEDMCSSTTKMVDKSFAKDYEDIKKFGARQNGYIHIFSSKPGIKVDLSDILDLSVSVMDENDAENVETKNYQRKKVKN